MPVTGLFPVSYSAQQQNSASVVSIAEPALINDPEPMEDADDKIFIQQQLRHSSEKGDSETAQCSYSEETFDVECISFHKDKPMKCPMCDEDVIIRKWSENTCPMARVAATKKLLDDFAAILNNQELSDVIIKVKGEEFRLHRTILAARNPLFRSMFSAEMNGNTRISIDYCEPDIFRLFVHFLYTGKMQISYDNVCALCEVAEKHQEEQLKAECLSFMKNNMSIGSFRDFIVLAFRYDEKELLRIFTEFFCANMREIIHSPEWPTFYQEYPMQAHELIVKAFDAK